MSLVEFGIDSLNVKEPEDIGRELGQRVFNLLQSGQTSNGKVIEFIADCPQHLAERKTFLTFLGLDPDEVSTLTPTKLLEGNGNILICEPLLGCSLDDKSQEIVYGWDYSVTISSETV